VIRNRRGLVVSEKKPNRNSSTHLTRSLFFLTNLGSDSEYAYSGHNILTSQLTISRLRLSVLACRVTCWPFNSTKLRTLNTLERVGVRGTKSSSTVLKIIHDFSAGGHKEDRLASRKFE
jgi:hypothetical protein